MAVTKSDAELRRFTLALAKVKGIGSVNFQKLLNEFGTIADVHAAYTSNKLPPPITSGISTNLATNWEAKFAAEVEYICVWEEGYPVQLASVADPPPVLFYRGNKELLLSTEMVSFVGTRGITSYGKVATHQLIAGLRQTGFTVVSGMATGIDTAAHLAALENNLPTIAVVPGPVDYPQPYANRYLYERILGAQGLIVSEVYPETKVEPWMFPLRNRIIAALGKATIVVEAGEKSGALITANLAFDYSREVLALPGRVIDISSKGCNQLIRMQKASLIESVNDVLRALGGAEQQADYLHVKITLSEPQQKLYNIVKSESRGLDEICELVDSRADDVISLLMDLQLQGLVAQDEFGDYFAVK